MFVQSALAFRLEKHAAQSTATLEKYDNSFSFRVRLQMFQKILCGIWTSIIRIAEDNDI